MEPESSLAEEPERIKIFTQPELDRDAEGSGAAASGLADVIIRLGLFCDF